MNVKAVLYLFQWKRAVEMDLHQWIIMINNPDLKIDQNNGNHHFGLNVAGQCEFSEYTCTHLSGVDCKKREITLKICVSEKVCLYCNIV